MGGASVTPYRVRLTSGRSGTVSPLCQVFCPAAGLTKVGASCRSLWRSGLWRGNRRSRWLVDNRIKLRQTCQHLRIASRATASPTQCGARVGGKSQGRKQRHESSLSGHRHRRRRGLRDAKSRVRSLRPVSERGWAASKSAPVGAPASVTLMGLACALTCGASPLSTGCTGRWRSWTKSSVRRCRRRTRATPRGQPRVKSR